MARKFSTGLRNLLNSKVPVVYGASIAGTDIAAVTSTTDSFTVTTGFTAAGFAVGDTIMVSGFLAAANNGIFTVATVTDTTIVITETTVTGEVAGPNVKIQCISGGSLKDIFKDCVLKVYSGTQPSDADQALTGVLLATFSVDHGTFTSGSPVNGLRFTASSAGSMAKDPAQVWQAIAVATGTAGWFRLYANAADAGALDSGYVYPRIDGAIGTSGAQLNMSSTAITLAASYTIDTFVITLPE